jgi:hypothetical protein
MPISQYITYAPFGNTFHIYMISGSLCGALVRTHATFRSDPGGYPGIQSPHRAGMIACTQADNSDNHASRTQRETISNGGRTHGLYYKCEKLDAYLLIIRIASAEIFLQILLLRFSADLPRMSSLVLPRVTAPPVQFFFLRRQLMGLTPPKRAKPW